MSKPLLGEPPSTASGLVYRPEIDGLRAVAVVLVVLFHAGVWPFSGGFIGVDVFFVISGFLITGFISRDIESMRFSFSYFYLRRFRRLLPAFLVVAIATTLVASKLMVPEDLKVYAGSLVAAWLGVSNILFSSFSGDYFSPRMEFFPLLHTWSLGAEEQFYLLWPAILVIGLKWRSAYFTFTLVLLLFASLIFSHITAIRAPSVAYYWLPFRAFELLTGALLCLHWRRLPILSLGTANVISVGALLILILMAVRLHANSVFPGFNGAAVAFATAALIYSVDSSRSFAGRVLSSRPVVGVGLISYSLYLWHWPIFSLARYRQIALEGPLLVTAIASSVLLAWLSWKFVEVPFRKSIRLSFSQGFWRLLVLPASLSAGFALVVFFGDGLPGRFSPEVRVMVNSYSAERDLMRKCSLRPADRADVSIERLKRDCAIGATSREPTALLIGDSHANHLRPFLEILLKDAERGAIYYVQGSCSAVHGLGDETITDQCSERNRALLAIAKEMDYVFFVSAWSGYKMEGFREGLAAAVEIVVSRGGIPVVFKDTPAPRVNLSRCILHNALGWTKADCDYSADEAFAVQQPYDEIIDEVALTYPDVVVVDPKPLLCGDSYCKTGLGSLAVYRDRHHLNGMAAGALGDSFLDREGNFLKYVGEPGHP